MNRFNLLEQAWIPVKGRSEPIKVCEIVQSDVIGLDAPRADFNAALMQFLIGILQTVYAPEDEIDWEEFYEEPPSETELQEKLDTIKQAFYLDGDGYRFMQDISIKNQGNKASVLKLIPGLVGGNATIKNTDFFLKSSQLSRMSLSNIILGFYLYQNYCLSETGGSKGRHHGSLRGRNSLIALINKDKGSLWENLWLNVIQKDRFKTLISNNSEKYHFEWMNDVPNGKQKLDIDIGIADIYWSMPRRALINFSESRKGICALSNVETVVIENIDIKEDGIDYKTNFIRHPLIPYKLVEKSKDDPVGGLRPIKINSTGLNYGDWLALIGNETASMNLLEHVKKGLNGDFKIFVCGYLNDATQAKTLCWYQTKMPLYIPNCSDEQKMELEREIDRYVHASKMVCNYLVIAIRNAWFDEDDDKNKRQKEAFNKDKSAEISRCFWNNTEIGFYEIVRNLYEDSSNITIDLKKKLRETWYAHLKKQAINLFNEWAFKSSIKINPKRISIAYNYRKKIESKGKTYFVDVGLENKLNGEFLKNILDL